MNTEEREIPERKPSAAASGRQQRLREGIEGATYALYERLGAARKIWISRQVIRGTERDTRAPLTTLYVGSGQSRDYLLDKIYADHQIEAEASRHFVLHARSLLADVPLDADLVLGDLRWPYYRWLPNQGFLRIPGWIVQRLPLADRWSDVVASFRKNTRTTDLRKVRKFGLTYRLTSQEDELRQFYRDLYAPYAQARFGALALIDSEDQIVHFGSRGCLLQVLYEGGVVGGVVLSQFRGTMHFLWIGLPMDLPAPTFDAAFSGIYYFSILHAYLEGCSEINLSYTRPWLSNGIYRYKRKWGAHVYDDWVLGEIWMRPVRMTHAVQSALTRQPCILRTHSGLIGKALLAPEATGSAAALRHTTEHFASPGLREIQLDLMGPLSDELRSAGPNEFRMRSLSEARDPAAEFCRTDPDPAATHSTNRL